jgi:ribosomal protein L7Ae-like RNA K-turn-binding protein
LLGLAIRAGQARGGTTAAEGLIRSGKAHLVLLASDTADHTRRSITRLAGMHNVPVLEIHTREEFGRCFSSRPRAVVVILNPHFAAGIRKKAAQFSSGAGHPDRRR